MAYLHLLRSYHPRPPCDFGGRGLVNTIDFLTGSMLPFPAFDINRNRAIGYDDDGLSAGIEISFLLAA